MAIIITKAKGTAKKTEPVILLTEDIIELNKDNIITYGAADTDNTNLEIDVTDIIKNPDVEFKSGSLASVLNTIGDSQYDKAIIVSNGLYKSDGTDPELSAGQSYEPNVVVAKGNLVTSPILGIDVNTDMDTDTPEDSPYGKELFLGISKIKGKTVDFEKYKISHKQEIYEMQLKLSLLDSVVNVSTVTLSIDNSDENNINITIYEDTDTELTAERFFDILTEYKKEKIKLNVVFTENNTNESYNFYVTSYPSKCILTITYGKEYTYELVTIHAEDGTYTVTASKDNLVVVKSEDIDVNI